MNNFLSTIDSCNTVANNISLLAQVSLEKITKAVYQIGGLKAPGPDGIHVLFYHTFLDQIKSSLFDFV